MLINCIKFFRYLDYHRKSQINFELLENVKMNTLLNLAYVYLKRKNYKSAVKCSKEVSLTSIVSTLFTIKTVL